MRDSLFYEEEVRNGYTITAKDKRVWAVQLDLLKEVDRICTKYQIPYFADSGTLIGAVRHGGYIPWDDDIDIVMLRKDYTRFIRLASKELAPPFILQTTYTERNYLRNHAQLRNSQTTGYNAEDKKAGYNCGIFLDVFPLDSAPDGRLSFFLWTRLVRFSWMTLFAWYRWDYYEAHTLAGKVLHALGKWLHIPMRKSFARYEKLCTRYQDKKTRRVCNTNFFYAMKQNTWNREWFASAVRMPFEDTTIPVPCGYDGRLRAEYGDYTQPAKAPSTHGGLVLDPDVAYTEYAERARE